MQQAGPPWRSKVLLALTVATGVLTAVTVVSAEWIEEIFGVDPDGGSGALEWAVVAGLAVVTILLAVATRLSWPAQAAADPST